MPSRKDGNATGFGEARAEWGDLREEQQVAAVTGFSDRLRQIIGAEPIASFARRVGERGSLISKYLDGVEPGISRASKIAEAAGVSLDWLIRGDDTLAATPAADFATRIATKPDTVMVEPPRLVTKRLSDGLSSFVGHPMRDRLALRADYALDLVGSESRGARATPDALETLALFEVVGEDMAPTLNSGDYALVDLSGYALEPLRAHGARERDRPIDGGFIYVVNFGVARRPPALHRLNWTQAGTLRLTSDHPSVADIDLDEEQTEKLEILGRVIWRCGPP